MTDVENCGECGHRCADDFPHAVVSCVSGQCRATECMEGWTDENEDFGEALSDGCECENLHVNDKGYEQCDSWNGRGGPYVLLPGGTFWQGCRDGEEGAYTCKGDEVPQHEVELSPFGMDVTEVTQSNYEQFMNEVKVGPPGPGWDPTGLPDFPVVYVTWGELRAYCRWAGGDLPTEAQWEYAARGEMDDPTHYAVFPWGTDEITCVEANISGCINDLAASGTYHEGVSPFGIYDLAGNVWEWCLDWFSSSYYSTQSWPQLDPAGPASGDDVVLRGGSYYRGGDDARCANRGYDPPGDETDTRGGRCVRPGRPRE
jgi:formylglycine-generating enzyme required for sulfatase activity